MTREQRWEQAMGWPLMVSAVAFLGAYAWPIIDPDLPHTARAACVVVRVATWVMFVVDYAVRRWLAEDRGHYFRHHLLDLGIVALPLLRPLRLLRILMVLTFIQRRAEAGLRGRVAVYVAGGSVLLAFCGALSVLDAERASPDANITGFGDAMWWAMTTMTTVGYGDRYPVTATGRYTAVALMVGGVALLGVVTATLASWLVEHVSEVERRQTAEVSAELLDVRQQLARLTSLIEARTERTSGLARVDKALP